MNVYENLLSFLHSLMDLLGQNVLPLHSADPKPTATGLQALTLFSVDQQKFVSGFFSCLACE